MKGGRENRKIEYRWASRKPTCSKTPLMNPRPPPGQLSLGHYVFFKNPGTEEDCPLLRVARTWINPDVVAGMRGQEAQAQQQAALQAGQASAVKRPVGRPRMDPASKPPLPPKRPVGGQAARGPSKQASPAPQKASGQAACKRDPPSSPGRAGRASYLEDCPH